MEAIFNKWKIQLWILIGTFLKLEHYTNTPSGNGSHFFFCSTFNRMLLFQSGGSILSPVVAFRYHTAPITSIEWNPNDNSVLAVSAADDRLTIWDFAVEPEDPSGDGEQSQKKDKDIPPQLLFVHQGQKEIKELHWHSQLPGVIISTANDGFNIFRTISA